MTTQDWSGYLADFHAERPGITETVLRHARDRQGRNPYAWAAQAVPPGARVLDLACGSAAMAGHLPGTTYLGLDRSAEELAAARAAGHCVVRADTAVLPLPDHSVDAVVVSMALMLVPLSPTLAEAARVLRPGGVLVATVPHPRPLPLRDWLRYARLCLALRHPGLRYPNDTALREPAALLAGTGLHLDADEITSFTCPLRDEAVADELLRSLYLPAVDQRRVRAGQRVVRSWVGTSITVPLRRLVVHVAG